MDVTPNGVIVRHADHGLGARHLAVIDEVLKKHEGFFIELVALPEGAPDLFCALYGPAVGDAPVGESEVDYEKRGERPGPSRLVKFRPLRPARNMVVIGIAGDDPVIFTAYGTRASSPTPREWWDKSMRPHEAIEAARFWSEHALAR